MLYDWYRNFIVQDSACVEKNRGNSDELTKEEDEMLNGEHEKSARAGGWVETLRLVFHGSCTVSRPILFAFSKIKPYFPCVDSSWRGFCELLSNRSLNCIDQLRSLPGIVTEFFINAGRKPAVAAKSYQPIIKKYLFAVFSTSARNQPQRTKNNDLTRGTT